ncbi:hypothetical protein PFICI_11952 [Pestalotiopsis fici W106-1]|uniref:Aminotransferase class I/classII large domain-containing protein n=1 Tax=Pestalotiopsis fici (strain W106-1 / CGMCC3.15140) TaxID=1229662 RepID=W3WRR9_PESFW|nr:uncharacterized protein PFICI_11952 [Pestalotiopsis fici W106-1]ETS76565.1 hypothetical protein PFICI_11952 [Pestalotiopsis fici W106-1]
MLTKSKTFSWVPRGPVDPMFKLKALADGDKSPSKVDLGAGVYRIENGQYHEFESIKRAKSRLQALNIGHDLASIQTVAGTGANRLGAAFLKKYFPSAEKSSQANTTKAFVGTPTWGNYEPLFTHAGIEVEKYRYYDRTSGLFDFDSTLTAAERAPEQSIFILQGTCHNPTGMDPSREQWKCLADIMRQRHHFAFFDVAYQGFGSQNADHGAQDVWAVRCFAELGIPMLVCQSFSKNMGLYSERTGALHVVCSDAAIASNVLDSLRSIARWEYSSAPAYGALLANIILNDKEIYSAWGLELAAASSRIYSLRRKLYHLLSVKYKSPGDWENIISEQGLFSYLKLNEAQVTQLVKEFRIYLPENGRINVSGLNEDNLEKVASSIDAVIRRINIQ